MALSIGPGSGESTLREPHSAPTIQKNDYQVNPGLCRRSTSPCSTRNRFHSSRIPTRKAVRLLSTVVLLVATNRLRTRPWTPFVCASGTTGVSRTCSISLQGGSSAVARQPTLAHRTQHDERIAHVRHLLNERLHHVRSGKRSREFARWVKQSGESTIVSMHGADVDLDTLGRNSNGNNDTESPTMALNSKDIDHAPLFPIDMRDMELVPVSHLPSQYPGKPQHLIDDKPPSVFKMVIRAMKLGIKFAPVSSTAWLAILSSKFREQTWYSWIASCLASSGPAFIKWGQWAATREDMFPEALCLQLAHLHNDAPAHSWTYTQNMMESSLGLPRGSLLRVFSSFDRTPLASGSIAQVHKAVLRTEETSDGTVVALKVRHPHVSRLIDMDFRIMSFLAGIVDAVPSLSWLRVKESVQQFSHTLAAQAHLNVEAHHLEVLNHNFRKWGAVRFPQPFYASSSVIMETFEPGRIVSNILDVYDALAGDLTGDKLTVEEVDDDDDDDHEYEGIEMKEGSDDSVKIGYRIIPIDLAKFIVTTGLSIYLKMLLVDNLMHADLHPGNILLDLHARANESTLSPLSSSRAVVPLEGQFQIKHNLGITLVDAGMVAQLTEQESANFIGILCAIGEGDGIFAAQCALRFSNENTLTAEERQAFEDDVVVVFQERCRGYHTNVDVGHVLRGVLGCIRDHRVRVDANYATLVVNCLCVESLARRVCPSYNVLDAAKPLLRTYRRIAYTKDGAPKNVSQKNVRRLIPLMNFRKEMMDNAFFKRQRSMMQRQLRAK